MSFSWCVNWTVLWRAAQHMYLLSVTVIWSNNQFKPWQKCNKNRVRNRKNKTPMPENVVDCSPGYLCTVALRCLIVYFNFHSLKSWLRWPSYNFSHQSGWSLTTDRAWRQHYFSCPSTLRVQFLKIFSACGSHFVASLWVWGQGCQPIICFCALPLSSVVWISPPERNGTLVIP